MARDPAPPVRSGSTASRQLAAAAPHPQRHAHPPESELGHGAGKRDRVVTGNQPRSAPCVVKAGGVRTARFDQVGNSTGNRAFSAAFVMIS